MTSKIESIDITGKDAAETIDDVTKHISAPVAPAHGIAALALSMAMKFHDITTIQDGTMYQQYKMEGKNMQPLGLEHVFETAIRIEQHLLASSQRIANLVFDALEAGADAYDEAAKAEEKPTAASDASS